MDKQLERLIEIKSKIENSKNEIRDAEQLIIELNLIVIKNFKLIDELRNERKRIANSTQSIFDFCPCVKDLYVWYICTRGNTKNKEIRDFLERNKINNYNYIITDDDISYTINAYCDNPMKMHNSDYFSKLKYTIMTMHKYINKKKISDFLELYGFEDLKI